MADIKVSEMIQRLILICYALGHYCKFYPYIVLLVDSGKNQ